jgi:Spy/CpxP family protein refolding chaperone
MRKLIVAAAAMLVMSSTAAIAQGGGGGGGGGQRGGMNMMAMLMKDITLSAEQQVKADSITKKFADMGAAMRADQTLDMQARRAKSMENRTKQQEELKAILTDDQKKVFDKNVADMAANMPGRPPQE